MSPDAEPASILKHAAARAVKNAERTILGEHIDNLPRTAGYAYFNVVRHMLPFEIERYCANIAIRRIGARANHDLINLLALHRFYRDDVPGAMGSRHKRLYL